MQLEETIEEENEEEDEKNATEGKETLCQKQILPPPDSPFSQKSSSLLIRGRRLGNFVNRSYMADPLDVDKYFMLDELPLATERPNEKQVKKSDISNFLSRVADSFKPKLFNPIRFKKLPSKSQTLPRLSSSTNCIAEVPNIPEDIGAMRKTSMTASKLSLFRKKCFL